MSFKTAVKRLPLLAAATLLLVQACGTDEDRRSAEPPAEKILATVNAREITMAEFERRTGLVLRYEGGSIEPSRLKDIKAGVLNELIEEALILMEAERLGITVGEDEVGKEVEAVKEGYTREEFETMALKSHETVELWEEGMRKNLLMKKVMDAVTRDMTVSDSEAEAYYRRNMRHYEAPETVRARMIVVSSEEKAKEALARLGKEGFDSVARAVSEGPEALSGGDLGEFSAGQMPPEFESAVFSLEPRRISPIIKTAYGYHIFLVEEKKKKRRLGFGEAKEDIVKKLGQEKKEAGFEEWLALEKKEALIEVSGGLL